MAFPLRLVGGQEQSPPIMSGIETFLKVLRPEIRNLPLYNAGLSGEYVRNKYGVDRIAKLGSNENPYGPSPAVYEAVSTCAGDAGLYPYSACDELRTVLAERFAVSPDRLCFGNGSEDIIAVASHTFLSPRDHVVTISPAFGLHVIHPQSLGAQVDQIPLKADYTLDSDAFRAAITPQTRMVVLSNPSNPVGSSISGSDMQSLLERVSDSTLILFDEAYFEYAATDRAYPDFLDMLMNSGRTWLILRTFSKAYGLAGLRAGFGIASSAVLTDLMNRVRSPFNVNRLAQIAAMAALQETEYMQDCVSRTVRERERVRLALVGRGHTVAPSAANFLFFDAQEDASALAERLLFDGVIVKAWRETRFREHLRVTIGTPEQNDHFLESLARNSVTGGHPQSEELRPAASA